MRRAEKSPIVNPGEPLTNSPLMIEEWFKRMFVQSALGMAISDKTFHFIAANQAFCAMLGYTEEEITHLTFKEITHPDYLAKDVGAVQKLLLGEIRSYKTEKQYSTKSGEVIDGAVTITSLHDDHGKYVHTLVVLENITQRKRLEEALSRTAQEWQKTFDADLDAVWLLDEDQKIIRCNKPSEKLFNLTREEMIGKQCREIVHGAGKPVGGCPVLRVKKSLHRESMELQTDNRWLAIYIDPILDDHGRISGYVHIASDITERKKTEGNLRKSEERYRCLVETTETGYVIIDKEGVVLDANQEYLRLSGRESLDEILGKSVLEWTVEEEKAINAQAVATCMKNGYIRNFNITYVDKKGKLTFVEVNATMMEAEGEKKILTLCRDVTDRKNMEEAMQRTAKLDSLGVLAGGIAHDFNNLLTGIFGYMDLARCESKDARITEYLEATLATMKRAKALTLQLLTFSKGGSPVRKVTPLVPFIQETAQFALSGSTSTCRCFFDENLKQCNIDKNQIAQVIDNIVINAQQAMPSGGDIEITAQNISWGDNEHPPLFKGDYVKIAIKDSGIGMPNDIMERIFDPFFTTKSKGHGLGLATSYSIIRQHDGCIDVESEQGRGSTFYIYLPASSEVVFNGFIKP